LRIRAAILLLAALHAVGAAAQPAPAPSSAADEPARLVVQGREIAVLRVRLLGYPPKDRALAAVERIRRALEADRPGTVMLREIPEGRMVEVAGLPVFALVPGDASALDGETFDAVTAQTVERLRTAVAEKREGRDARRLLVAAGLAVAATAVVAALLFALSSGRRRIEQRLDAALRRRLEALKRVAADAVPKEHLTGVLRVLIRTAVFFLGVAVVLFWLDFVLTRFPFTRPLGERFTGLLLDALGTVGAAILGMIPGLLVVVIIFFLTRYLVRLVGAFFRRIETGEVEVTWLERDLAAPTRRIAVGILWLFAVVMSYPYLPGSGSDAFKGISVLVGLMISLGSTSLVGQAASGLMLLYSRTIRVGEWVRIGEHEGVVTNVGMLTTRLRTGLGEEKVLPNNVVVGTTTLNFSRHAKARGHLVQAAVTIGYGAPWRQVEALLLLAAERTPGLRKEPAPFVVQRALSDYYVEYHLYAFMDDMDRRLLIVSELHANIQDAFNEFGVQIMSPHYRGDPAQPVVVPKEKWHLPPTPPAEEPRDR
jgi:small-conductance mechanosensitive channel